VAKSAGISLLCPPAAVGLGKSRYSIGIEAKDDERRILT
jgi:hypothetical protein